jgi:hypothetical protein
MKRRLRRARRAALERTRTLSHHRGRGVSVSWLHRTLLRAEDALGRGLSGMRDARAREQGRRAAEPAQFRGRACHCDPSWPVHLVHSEGLREACDFVVDLGANARWPERPAWPIAALAPYVAELPAGATLHLKADWIAEFARHLLPTLRAPIVVVSGDSDAGFRAEHEPLLEHPNVAHWFAQNCETPRLHRKLTRIPIGVDNPVYTKLEKRLGFALTIALGKTPFDASLRRNDMGQQDALCTIARSLRPTRERAPRVLCTFHQNQKLITPDLSEFPERAQALRALGERTECHFITRRLRQAECWRLHGEFAFQLSPRGRGLDCFRTWESLFLGTIPIVRRSSLDPLYDAEELPVVRVDDFREVTAARLDAWRERYAGAFTPALEHKLSLDYWRAKIARAARCVRQGKDVNHHDAQL